MHRQISLAGLLVTVFLAHTQGTAQSNVPETKTQPSQIEVQRVRSSVERALPYIEKHGAEWIEKKKCATCHHSTFLVWSLNVASDHGFSVESGKLTEWNAWVRDFRSIRGRERTDANEFLAHKTFQGSPDEVSQLLLGRRSLPTSDSTNEQNEKWAFAMSTMLLDGQQKDGSWKPGGQLPSQKRPLRETAEVTTMWTLIAVHRTRKPDDELRTAEQRAADWMGTETIGESAEWWATKMLWERSRGNADGADICRVKLLQSQREDGGWGWLLAEESDALGTGIVLYALSHDGLQKDHESFSRAVEFLLHSQQPDGSWKVRGTKQNRRERVEPTAVFWGTCWAVIGLLETLTGNGTEATQNGEIRSLSRYEFDDAQVNDVAFSPDGSRLAVAGKSTIHLVDLRKNSLVYRLDGHTGPVRSVSFSADGKLLASGSDDKTIRIWDVNTGKQRAILIGDPKFPAAMPVSCVKFTSGDKVIVSCGTNGFITFWDVTSGAWERKSWTNHAGKVGCQHVALSADGKRMAIAGGANPTLFVDQITLHDVEHGLRQRATMKHGDDGPASHVAFASGGDILATCGADEFVRIWDFASGSLLRELRTAENASWQRAYFTPRNERVAAVNRNGQLQIWNQHTGEPIESAKVGSQTVTSMALAPDGKSVAVCGESNEVHIWSLFSKAPTEISP